MLTSPVPGVEVEEICGVDGGAHDYDALRGRGPAASGTALRPGLGHGPRVGMQTRWGRSPLPGDAWST
jgi:hypothetical protein